MSEKLENTVSMSTDEQMRRLKYEDQKDIVEEINSMNLSWKAEVHEEFKGLSLLELNEKLGFKRSRTKIKNPSSKKSHNIAKNYKSPLNQKKLKTNFLKKTNKLKGNKKELVKDTLPKFYQVEEKKSTNHQEIEDKREKDSFFVDQVSEIQKYLNKEIDEIDENLLAKNWDWRNVSGQNFVPRLRLQKSCGSCYVFSSVSSLESRLRVLTNNVDKTEFSRQFPLSCSPYTEGCDGGYPILVGKFFNEFEIIPEECFEYEASNVSCSRVCDYTKYKKKYSVSKYEYLGGFYGATSEVSMMKEIRARGPIPGNISVPWSFSYYKDGIYSHEKFLSKNVGKLSKSTLFDKRLSWEKVDHSILIVGWGEENGVKFWIGMNTWGSQWGENGFFRILRGENECSIESMGDSLRIKVEDR
jgi:C1A family cysteine protease